MRNWPRHATPPSRNQAARRAGTYFLRDSVSSFLHRALSFLFPSHGSFHPLCDGLLVYPSDALPVLRDSLLLLVQTMLTLLLPGDGLVFVVLRHFSASSVSPSKPDRSSSGQA